MEFFVFFRGHKLERHRESAVPNGAHLQHVAASRNLSEQKSAIWAGGGDKPGSGNRYFDLAKRLAPLGIGDRALDVASDRRPNEEQQEEKVKCGGLTVKDPQDWMNARHLPEQLSVV